MSAFGFIKAALIIRSAFKLHAPQEITLPDGSWGNNCTYCDGWTYPCATIRNIKAALND
jgi:hypothetical protein